MVLKENMNYENMFRLFGFIAPKPLDYLAFQSFGFERTWWRLFQKRIVRTKFDIYVFINTFKHVYFPCLFWIHVNCSYLLLR